MANGDEKDLTKGRMALYRNKSGDYFIEDEEWPGSIKQAEHNAKKRGLTRITGSQSREVLEAGKANLENAKS